MDGNPNYTQITDLKSRAAPQAGGHVTPDPSSSQIWPGPVLTRHEPDPEAKYEVSC
jgi:hypothetical protein